MIKDNDNQSVRDTERAILMAAEREFMAKGFTGARTTSIAEAAGVTHAMLHYYFRTKEKLFDRIMSEKIALLQEALFSTVGDRNSSLEEIISAIIDTHLDFLAANPDLPRFLIGEIYNHSERAEAFIKKIKDFAPVMINAMRQRIEAGVKRGVYRKVDAVMLMLDIVSLNVFSFMAAPLVNAVLGKLTTESQNFISDRKRENYDTIMRKLKADQVL